MTLDTETVTTLLTAIQMAGLFYVIIEIVKTFMGR